MNNIHNVSVIIVCRNEIKYIDRCIKALLAQKKKNLRVEIIAVDGMSTDGTKELILSTYSHDVKLFINKQQYTPQAINIGISKASGEFIAVVGGRSVLNEDYLEQSINILLNNEQIWCTGGRIIHKGEDTVSNSIAATMSSITGVGLLNFRTLNATQFVDTVSTPVFRKTLFNSIGAFDETCIRNQDDDFSYRIIQAGGKILLNAAVSSEYYVRKSYRNLFNQYFQYAFWKIVVNKKHKTITSVRQVFPALLITSILISALFSLSTSLAVISIYLITIVLGSLITSIQSSCSFLPAICSNLIMHFSYGLGYLYGILNVLLLNNSVPATVKRLTR